MMIKNTIFNLANSLMGRKFFLAILGVLSIAKMYEAQLAEMEPILIAALDLTGDAQAHVLAEVTIATGNAFGYAVASVAGVIGLSAIAQALSDKGDTLQGAQDELPVDDAVDPV